MRKVWIIAVREYRAIVGTKAFLIAICLMPILMFGGIFIQKMLEGRGGPAEKTIAVLDGTGVLFDALQKAAEARDKNDVFDRNTGKQLKPRYLLEAAPAGKVTEETRYELSERIRRRQIDAFVEIPAEVLRMPSGVEGGEVQPKVAFHAENAAVSEEKGWIGYVLNEVVRAYRLQKAAGVDPELVRRASTPVNVEPLGLLERSRSGEIAAPQQASMHETIFVPFGIMMLMWMVIFLAAQPMLESVLEEKSQRIAEVLLGSVDAFRLMIGKLLGGVGGSLTVVIIYAIGACGLAWYFEALHLVPLRVIPWFIVYQVLAVMLFGSVFMAVGAAVNQLKEAQGMLLPIWLIMMLPLMIWFQVIREPTGGLATWVSFFPPATPLMMVLRIGATSAVPSWQPALGILVLLATTLLIVFAAARIFRIGFLAQGKTPKLAELLRWAFRG